MAATSRTTIQSYGDDEDRCGPKTREGDSSGLVSDAVIQQNINKFDMRYFPFSMPPTNADMSSRIFSPQDKRDFTALRLRVDHPGRPLWADGWGTLILESFHPLASQAQDFLITIAEPISRPAFLHEYRLTTHSLYAAVSLGLQPQDIIGSLGHLLKTELPPNVADFIRQCGSNYGKIKLVLIDRRYFLETTDLIVLQRLLKDEVLSACRGATDHLAPSLAGISIAGTSRAAGVRGAMDLVRRHQPDDDPTKDIYRVLQDEEDKDDEDHVIHAFQIQDDKVSNVAERCLQLGLPALEEYDFRNDASNADLDIDLRPATNIRSYQEKSLSKVFGNGRAKSGIIVLPCGAGKTLVGITAACTIKKGVIVLATSNMSVLQWRSEFLKWSNVHPDDIAVFTSDQKSTFSGNTGIIVTTYSMVTNTKDRSHESSKMMQFLQKQEWGLMLLDEVHVVPAHMFRRVIGTVKAHAKLGLTATLLREDDKIEQLNFLIGPKLYEANWMELSQQGHIAKVQCAEVWCPMPTAFYEEYLRAKPRHKSLLYAMNPAKFQACQYLIKYHEERGDKIIVFSDNVYALEQYARRMMRPYLYGGTSNAERSEILQRFRDSTSSSYSTIFLSKIGDTSLDLPEATCLIQISSQYGSRRQEAQRLGRILRAKRRSDEGFNAFFYSLVSKDTQEMYFSSKRQAFLVDQGYAFKIITHLHKIELLPDLAFNTPEEQRELLQMIRVEIESKSWMEEQEETEAHGLARDDNLFHRSKKARKKVNRVKRRGGVLDELSGGQDMAYTEQNESVKKISGKGPHSEFFKAQRRAREKRQKAARASRAAS